MTHSLKIPFNEEMERALLGSVLIDYKNTMNELVDVDESIFYIDNHKEIFKSMLLLSNNGSPIDIKTVYDQLIKNMNNKVTVDYLLNLAEETPTAAHAKYYCDQLTKLSTLRKMAELCQTTYKQILTGDVQDLNDLLMGNMKALSELSENGQESEFKSFYDLAKENIKEQENIARTGKTDRIKTLFPSLDKLTGGFKGGDLIVIGARPSVGKTAFALNLALKMGKGNHKAVPVFSVEMRSDSICYRMMAGISGINNNDFKSGVAFENESKKVYAIAELSKKYNVYVNDKSAIKVSQMKAALIKFMKDHPIQAIVIDYLQLLKGSRKFNTKNEEVSEISRDLKLLARELDVPVIVLSQLSRNIEQREDKRPRMSDLRDSGSVEQDADVIMMLWREDYQNFQSNSDISNINIDVVKCRDGSIGSLTLAFDKPHSWFSEITKKDIRQ